MEYPNPIVDEQIKITLQTSIKNNMKNYPKEIKILLIYFTANYVQ